jgi:hypothetical protein
VAAHFGFLPGEKRVRIQSIVDARAPKLPVVWEKALELPVFETPAEAKVFAVEKWERAPVLAGYRKGAGAVLWVITSPGKTGYERFPYVLHALSDLGLQAPFRSNRLWAFFDYSYHTRVDLDYMAAKWRQAGIGALHVAAWHFYDPDPERDEYLRRLIEASHRRGIQVYAWIELPHVSEKFWDDNPQWRERTALLQDAHLDWRKLMNLQNRECFQAAAEGTRKLAARFDWDGLNLAELYFESLEGYPNPARFTPFNDDVRAEFRRLKGFDPTVLYDKQSPLYHEKTAAGMRAFLNFRNELAERMQREWIAEMEEIRRAKPDLDLVLTHVDDRFDTQMRDVIGADAGRILPLLEEIDFTFLIEDPATIWHLGPDRYPEIARRYWPLTPHRDKLAIDINIVERYQDVYPTKQQTGTELYQLVHLAAGAFHRVALYFENSILKQDLALLPASAATVTNVRHEGPSRVVDSPYGTGLVWNGPALVNGKLWPVIDGKTVWLPAGEHRVDPSAEAPAFRMLDFTGDLLEAESRGSGIQFRYTCAGRAFAVFDAPPGRVLIDGKEVQPRVITAGDRSTIYLPRGEHEVAVERTSGAAQIRTTR